MKKQLSVFMLIVRSSIWKVLLILGAMVLSQVLLFFIMGAGEEAYLLNALQRIPLNVVVLIGFSLQFLALAIPLSDRGGRMNNLILRLGLSEKQIFWLQVLFNIAVYCLFFLVQALTMLLLCLIYDWVTPGDLDPFAVFATSYQYPFFHAFFPLHNVVGWLTNLVMVLGLGICTAALPVRQRHRLNSLCSILMNTFAVMYYCNIIIDGYQFEYSYFGVVMIFVFILVTISLYGVLTMEVDDDGKT